MTIQEMIDDLYLKANTTKTQRELAKIEEIYREKDALTASVLTEFNAIRERMIMIVVHKGEEYKGTASCVGAIIFQTTKRKLLLKIGKTLP